VKDRRATGGGWVNEKNGCGGAQAADRFKVVVKWWIWLGWRTWDE